MTLTRTTIHDILMPQVIFLPDENESEKYKTP